MPKSSTPRQIDYKFSHYKSRSNMFQSKYKYQQAGVATHCKGTLPLEEYYSRVINLLF